MSTGSETAYMSGTHDCKNSKLYQSSITDMMDGDKGVERRALEISAIMQMRTRVPIVQVHAQQLIVLM